MKQISEKKMHRSSRMRYLWITLLMLLAGSGVTLAGLLDGNVAKVGNTEYATIEEAIAAWGPGKTLTLLADVTTTSTVEVEVNATKSTQNWILNLGDYTWTANGCNAIHMFADGGTAINSNYGLKINANQSGGITANGKYVVHFTNKSTISDSKGYRPRLEINGGTYNGSYIVYYQNGNWFNFCDSKTPNGVSTFLNKSSDGTEPVFNGNFDLSKCVVTVSAGYFNGTQFKVYRVSSTVDPRLYGGHFKTYSAFPVPGNNKGIAFHPDATNTTESTYIVFAKADASIDVVNGAPATYEAKATKTLLLSSNQAITYYDYVYYEKANDAINKYSSGTIEIILSEGVTATESKSFSSGTLTIDASAAESAYTGTINLAGNSAVFITKFPEGGGHYGVTVSRGQLHVEESISDGIVTRTYTVTNAVSESEAVAKIGDVYYKTIFDAFYAADGTEGKTITLLKDVSDAGFITNGKAVNGTGKTDVTFDLNGHSIGFTNAGVGKDADYTLTIIDSSQDKTGVVTNSLATFTTLALENMINLTGQYEMKIQAGTWQFDPSAISFNSETRNLVDEGYYAHDNGNGTWTVGELPFVAKIGDVKYHTLDAAVAAANEGETIEVIKAGDYKLPNLPKNVTIEGKADDVVSFTHTTAGSIASVPNGATFKNVTFNFGNVNYHGFQHAGTINMDGCTLNGKFFSYGDMNFTNCEFENADDYNMWVYGAGNVVYDQCTFTNTTTGRLLHLYCEDANLQHKVTVKDCKFVNNGSLSKAAINVKATSGNNLLQYELHLEGNNTYEGNFPTAVGEQANSDKTYILNPLAQVDDRKIDPDNITVWEGEKKIYPVQKVVKVTDNNGTEKFYADMKSAFDAINADPKESYVITLLDDAEYADAEQYRHAALTAENTVTKNVVINGDGHTLTFAGGGVRGFYTTSTVAEKVVFNNMTIVDNTRYDAQNGNNAWEFAYLEFGEKESCAIEFNNVKFADGISVDGTSTTFNNCEFIADGNPKRTTQSSEYCMWISNGEVTVNSCSFTGFRGPKIHEAYGTEVSKVTFDGCTFKDLEKKPGIAIGTLNADTEVTIINSTIEGVQAGDQGVYLLESDTDLSTFNNNFSNNSFNVKNESEFAASLTTGYFTSATLLDNVTLTKEIATNLGSTDFSLTLGEKNIDKAGFNVVLQEGVTINTDKQTDIFSAPEDFKVVETATETGYAYTIVPKVYVAQIGEAKYETLTAALTAATDGQTVKLLADIDGTDTTKEPMSGGTRQFVINKSITLDGDGHTVTTKNRGFGVGMNATSKIDVTFKNVTILNTSDGARCIDTRGNINSLTLDGVTLNTNDASGYTQPLTIGGNQADAATINITNSTIQTNDDATAYYAIITFNPVNMTIEGSTIKGWANIYAKAADGSAGSAGSVFTINNSTLVSCNAYSGESNTFAAFMVEDNNVTINVTNSDVTIQNTGDQIQAIGGAISDLENVNVNLGDGNKVKFVEPGTYAMDYNSANVVVSGGIFSESVPEKNCAEGYIPTANTDEATKAEYPYAVKEGVFVAQIGEVKYESLADAVAAVPTDGTETTIVMIANEMINVVGSAVTVPATKNIILDLNGYQVVGTAEGGSTSALITNRGTLTIKDSSDTNADGTGTGKLISGATTTWIYEGDGNYAGSYASNTITNSGTLNIESGYVENLSTGSATYAVDNNSSGADAILNMKGGLLKAHSVAVRQFANSTAKENTVNVTGGTIQAGYSGIWIQLPGSNADQAVKARLNVEGGNLTGGSYAFYDYSYGNNFDATQYNLSGGTFNGSIFSYGANIDITDGTYNGDVAIKQAKPSTVAVSGGKFGGDVYTYGANASEGFITGGLYATKTYEDEGNTYDCDWLNLLAEGYISTNNKDEATKEQYPYMVKLAAWVAQVGDVKYETLAEAVEAATAGQTVELLANITDENVVVNKELTILKNGFTVQENNVKADDGFLSEETMKKIVINRVIAEYPYEIAEGYYRIKNLGNGSYVNVIGRRTATVSTSKTDAQSLAGTVIKVNAPEGKVETLRSQAVDIPHYAERAMTYVPEFVEMVVQKLGVEGSGEILGTTGVDAIMDKFNKNFDYHLHTEQAGDGAVRIYGKTPRMKPVVEFYEENKDKVDAKLPQLEEAINDAIDKVVDKLGRGESLRNSFNLHKVWERMSGTLTEPVNEASKVAFMQEVLMDEAYVWDFGYQAVMIYVEKVEKSSYFNEMPAELKKYWNLAKQTRPGFKYYIVQKDGQMDIISEGNIDIINDNDRTKWVLEPAENFDVDFTIGNMDGEYFATIYTDFGYQLPSGVTAYKVTGIDDNDVAQIEEIGQAVAAQTPVLLKSTTGSGTKTLTIGNYGTSVSGNQLHGADWVINEYDIKNSTVQGLFEIVASVSQSVANEYDYLTSLNSGTVGNKYFFPVTVDGQLSDAYEAKTGNKMDETPVHYLGVTEDGKVAFVKSWDTIAANAVYMFNETIDPIYLDEPEYPANIAEGYYRIKNDGNNSYVNVRGRRTATVNATEADTKTLPGTVLKVKATNGEVEILRSQAVDLPYYAQRAMSYVPDVVELVVNKLGVDGSGEILGSTGVDAIMQKFNESFDYHLHVEFSSPEAAEGTETLSNLRIYGKTPSMRPVVEFYQEHKDQVDAKLPMLESEINAAIQKVVEKAGMGSSLLNSFKLETIWTRMGGTLTKPTDNASKLAFLKEVLASEANVWNFAYQTATFYMEKVEGSSVFDQIPAEIRQYWNLAKQVHPNFKYYIVQKDGKMDFISEGNIDIQNNAARTTWSLEPITEFTVNIPETNSKLVGKDKKEYYTTLYTDFGYQLPKGVTALKVTEIKDVQGLGLAVTEEIGREVAPQTPVLIKSETAGAITLTIGDNYGSAVTGNLLHGADWLINEFEINTPSLEGLFNIFKKISASTAEQYEYLLRRNSGTVNNKYFFPINAEDITTALENKGKNGTLIRILDKNGKFLAFYDAWELPSNAVFIYSEDYTPVFLYLIGDVDRDGDIDLDDVNATIDIVLSRDTEEDNYDYEAADVDETYEEIDGDDVNTLIDLVLDRISLKSLIEKILKQ